MTFGNLFKKPTPKAEVAPVAVVEEEKKGNPPTVLGRWKFFTPEGGHLIIRAEEANDGQLRGKKMLGYFDDETKRYNRFAFIFPNGELAYWNQFKGHEVQEVGKKFLEVLQSPDWEKDGYKIEELHQSSRELKFEELNALGKAMLRFQKV